MPGNAQVWKVFNKVWINLIKFQLTVKNILIEKNMFIAPITISESQAKINYAYCTTAKHFYPNRRAVPSSGTFTYSLRCGGALD